VVQTGLRMQQTAPRLVRLVARHFDDLKGFDVVPLALALAGAGWGWSSTNSRLAMVLAGGAGLVVGLIAYLFVVDSYHQLGRVATSSRSRVYAGWFGGATIVLMRLQAAFLPGPSVIWFGFGLYWLWLAVDGWPWRWYHVLTCAAAVYVAFGRAAVAHPGDFAWMAPRLWVFSLTWLSTAIADHRLLLRTMRVTPFDEDFVSNDA
jgi:hypothetical protein